MTVTAPVKVAVPLRVPVTSSVPPTVPENEEVPVRDCVPLKEEAPETVPPLFTIVLATAKPPRSRVAPAATVTLPLLAPKAVVEPATSVPAFTAVFPL